MKKTKLYLAFISLAWSLNAIAIGLGDMTVLSSLDQPFDAEIALIDVGDVPLSDMKANLAEGDDYERAGVERSSALNTLTFVIERNRQGQAVIHVRSIERMSEPFLQLLIDLAWAKGQIYRGYDVLLDPPDYQLAVQQHSQMQPIQHHSYKKRVPLPQQQEDHQSSQLNQPLQAANTPSSVHESETRIASSYISSVPSFARLEPMSKQYLSASQDTSNLTPPEVSHLEGIGTALKAQMDVTVQAIDSLRESNALLKEQLHSMQNQNQVLQDQLKQRDIEMKHMQAQIELLMHRQGVAGQVIQSGDTLRGTAWLLWLFILLGMVGGAYLAFRRWGAPDVIKIYHMIESRIKPQPKVHDDVIQSTSLAKEPSEPVIQQASLERAVESEEMPEKSVLEPHMNLVENTTEPSVKEDIPTHNLIEFEPVTPSEEAPLKPVRSKSALDTLLTLSQTYIEMGNIAAAHESLKEVLEHGTKKQQLAAKKLLEKFDKDR